MSGSDQNRVKIHRFIGEFDLSTPTIVVRDKELLHQWSRVLRFTAGDTLILCNGNRHEIVGKVLSLAKDRAEIEVMTHNVNQAEPEREVVLYAAILKREHFEWMLQKAVEVGVTRIVPMRSHRTVKLNVKRERLEAIIREAAEQSGRGIMPVLSEPMSFPDAIADSDRYEKRFFLDLSETNLDDHLVKPLKSAAAFIGPEGGWSPEERLAARHASLTPVSIGPLVLRGETAAILAGYLLTR